jgi:KDO2-lipid IV(A) lauroyltransferase
MRIKELLSQSEATRWGFALGRRLPPFWGRAVARLGADLIVWGKPEVYFTVLENQRHLVGPAFPESELRARVATLFRQAAVGYYEIFHNLERMPVEPDRLQPPVRLPPQSAAYLQAALADPRGLCIFGCHLSNFDLGGLAMARFLKRPAQVLSLADPRPGFAVMNALRQRAGGENFSITPITPTALREAMQLLKQGGVVYTGVERPTGAGDQPVEFFGATACLPTGYIRIPMATRALIMTLATVYEEGEYRLILNPSWEPVQTGDREQDSAMNLRRVLDEIEGLIRLHPEQWMMFVPVWK